VSRHLILLQAMGNLLTVNAIGSLLHMCRQPVNEKPLFSSFWSICLTDKLIGICMHRISGQKTGRGDGKRRETNRSVRHMLGSEGCSGGQSSPKTLALICCPVAICVNRAQPGFCDHAQRIVFFMEELPGVVDADALLNAIVTSLWRRCRRLPGLDRGCCILHC
jgi:hypothetical protein